MGRSQTIAIHSTDGPIIQPSGSRNTVGKDSLTSTTKGCHHSINTSTNTYKNNPPAYNREDLPRSTSSTSNVVDDVPGTEPTRGVVPSIKDRSPPHTRPTDRAGMRKTGVGTRCHGLGAIISKGGQLRRCTKVKETRLVRRETLGSPSHTVQKGVMILRALARDHRAWRRISVNRTFRGISMTIEDE